MRYMPRTARPTRLIERCMLLLHAQGELGDVVYVELPEVGKAVKAKETFGVVESVKVRSAGHAWKEHAAISTCAWACMGLRKVDRSAGVQSLRTRAVCLH